MQAAQLKLVDVFDATKQFTFNYNWNGEPAKGSKLTIRDNETNVIVFEYTEMRMDFSTILPANSIPNGYKYSASIVILDASGSVISDVSPSITFWCHKSATLTLNSPPGGTVGASNYLFTGNYRQLDDEGTSDTLAFYNFELYGDSQQLLKRSDTVYLSYEEWVPLKSYSINDIVSYCGAPYKSLKNSNTDLPTNPASWSYYCEVSHTFDQLQNESTYYVKLTGQTSSGENLATDLIQFYVYYEYPSVYASVTVINNWCSGTISLVSDMIAVDGHTTVSPVVYIDGEYVDMRNGVVVFDSGYTIPQDYVVDIEVKHIAINKCLLKWKDLSDRTAQLFYREAEFICNNNVNKGYFELLIDTPAGDKLVLNTDFIDPIRDNNKEYRLYIKRSTILTGAVYYTFDAVLMEV